MHKKIFLIFLIALALRLIYIFGFLRAASDLGVYTYEYDRLGWNLASGNGFSLDSMPYP